MKFHPRKLAAAFAAALLSVYLGTASAGDARSFVSGNFFLTLDGANSGFIKSVEGGSATADVVEEQVGPDRIVRKRLGPVKYEDITIQLGFSNAHNVYEWIAATLRMQFQRRSGSIIAANFQLRPVSELEFFRALITEFTIPTLDAASKDPGFLTLKFAPELTRVGKADGTLPTAKQQKRWLPANFRLVIDGLDTSRVSKIDSFTIKQQVIEDSIGENRDLQKEPGKLEIPNLKITFSASTAQSWRDWHEDFVIKGNNGQENEKSGTLEFLSSDLKTVLGRLRFFNMGIFSLGPAKPARNPCQSGCPADPDEAADLLGKMQAELYVERMELEVDGSPQ